MPLALRELLTDDGASRFGEWFESLDVQAAAKVVAATVRMEQGNLGGGTKKSQWRDVEQALIRWNEYKQRKSRR